MPGDLGADRFVPVGYESCRQCGDWWVAGSRRGRLCAECAAALSAASRTSEVIASIEGRRIVNRPTRSRRRKTKVPETERKRLWNRARSRAVQRLIRVYPDTYAVLLAEAMAELGLDPRLDRRAPGARPIERELAG